MNETRKISWVAADHIKKEKTSDWFWIVGIVGIGAAILSIYFNNFLFALLILIGLFAIFMQANDEPKDKNFEINRKGVVVGSTLYPYSSLESFYIIDEDGWDRDRILIKSNKMLMPLIVIPLGESADIDSISNYLLEYLNEEELEESAVDKIAILFGF